MLSAFGNGVLLLVDVLIHIAEFHIKRLRRTRLSTLKCFATPVTEPGQKLSLSPLMAKLAATSSSNSDGAAGPQSGLLENPCVTHPWNAASLQLLGFIKCVT